MPTVYLSPDPINSTQLIPGGVIPASGGKLFQYLAGSSTKTDTYTDITGSVKWSNPIVLDSGGNLGGSNEVWIPAGITVKFVLAPFNDTDPPIAPYKTWDNISGINDISTQLAMAEWIAGPTPTFVSTTSFTLVGDQTAIFTPGRRVKTTNTAGTRYGTISTSVFGAVTTVTITNDSGTLDAGLSAVWYALINPVNTSLPLIVSVLNFGAKGDGVTDDTAALNAAFAQTGKSVLLPKGNYLCNSGLNAPICSSIIGEGSYDTKITFATGVIKGFSITSASNAHLTRMMGFSIVGNATTNAQGIVFGDTGLIANLSVYDVYVHGWTGTGAVGCEFQDINISQFYNLFVASCTRNMHFQGNTSVPTTLDFYSLWSELATNEGCLVEDGDSIRFHNSTFQTNGKEGLKVAPLTNRNTIDIIVNDPWFEGNYGSDTANYHMVCDGSAAGATCRTILNRGYFNTDGSHAKSIKLTGAGIAACYLDRPQIPNLAGQIFIDTNINSVSYELPDNRYLSATAIVSDTAAVAFNLRSWELAWTAYVPTYSTNIGDAATSFTATPTTNLARYKRTGKTVAITLSVAGTLKAITPSTISASLPLTPQNSSSYTPAVVANAGTFETGLVRATISPNLISFNRANVANWGSGATFECDVSYAFESA